ncbi:hypothetical protein R3P38DRAFT_2476135, partial [Favolaschia claudopus]
LSGSTLHSIILPSPITPNGVDIFCPPSEESSMAITIDTRLEFTEQTQAIDPFPGYSGFRHIRTFCKDENTIYLVVVADENAINVIFQFHATADMNFLSGYGLFCAYPNLTFNNKSYTNP